MNMDPVELSEIMSGDGAGITTEMDESWYEGKPIPSIKLISNDSVEITNGKTNQVKEGWWLHWKP